MKKFLHAIVEFVLCLLTFVVGGILIYEYAYGLEIPDDVFSFIKNHSYIWPCVGLVLIFIVIAFVITLGDSRRGPGFVSFSVADGDVMISRNAIADFIRRIGEDFSAIESLEPVVSVDKKSKLRISLNITIKNGENVPDLSKLLQAHVRDSLRDDLGFKEIKSISVKVLKISEKQVEKRTQIEVVS